MSSTPCPALPPLKVLATLRVVETRANGQLGRTTRQSSDTSHNRTSAYPIVADTDSSGGGRHVAATRIQFQWDTSNMAGILVKDSLSQAFVSEEEE